MNEQDYIKLVLKFFLGTLNDQEKKIFDKWLEEGNNRKILKLLEAAWNSKEENKNIQSIDLDLAWKKLSRNAGISMPVESFNKKSEENFVIGRKKKKLSYQIMRFAAVFLIAFSFLYVFNNKKNQEISNNEYHEIVVHYGKQKAVKLPDGSKIILDSGSKLKFNKNFVQKREVFLYGEAYFEVVHNPLKPFVIHAKQGLITVIGTKFDISAWPENNEVKVIVVDGKVSFKNESYTKSNPVVIEKGKMSLISDNNPQPSPAIKVNTANYLAWMKRNLILDNTPLYEVLNRLSRWYNLQFQLPSSVYKNVTITGTFKNQSLDQILKTIGLMTELNFRKEGNTIVFYKR